METTLTPTPLAVVFANNIQTSQLKEVIPQHEWSKEVFEEERENFLEWLTNPKEGSKFRFDNQLSAWEEYKRQSEFSEPEDDEIEDISWSEELELLAYMKANTIEFLGNYDYESVKGGSYPSQQ